MSISREQTDPQSCPDSRQGKQGAEASASGPARVTGAGAVSAASGADAGQAEQLELWVRQAQAGDRDAFEKIVLALQDRVWRLALYRIRDHDEAYDVAQEVFSICFRKIGQFRGESKFWTWLSRIVENQVKNRRAWLERRGRSRTVSLDNPGGSNDEDNAGTWDLPDPGPSPRRQAEGREKLDALNASMDKLSDEHREVLLLRFSDGLSYEEISQTLDVSLGTVKSRINRGRGELRKLMAGALD